jgi:DNA topoisomerase-1
MLACTGYPWCEHTRDLPTPEAAAAACQNCGKAMVLKRGRFGEFLSCTGYPACKTTRKVAATGQQPVVSKPDQVLDEPCPQCQSNLVVKHGRFGEFTACSNYPSCKYVKQKSTGLACPKDNGDVIERKSRQGKVFFGCANYPACDFVLWNRPVLEACPQCGEPFLVEKITKRHGRQLVCHKDDCDYARSEPLAPA